MSSPLTEPAARQPPSSRASFVLVLGVAMLVVGAVLAYDANTALQALQQLAGYSPDFLAERGIDGTYITNGEVTAKMQLGIGFLLLAGGLCAMAVGAVRLSGRRKP